MGNSSFNGTKYSVGSRKIAATSEILESVSFCEEDFISKIEKFAFIVFGKSKKTDCLWLLLSSKLGQKQFKFYLRKENVEEWMIFFQDLMSLRKSTADANLNEITETMTSFINSYLINDTPLSNYLLCYYEDQYELLNKRALSLTDIQHLINQLLSSVCEIMANCFIDPFFASRSYVSWRCMEKSHAVAITKEDMLLEAPKINVNENVVKIERRKSIDFVKRMETIMNPFDAAVSAMNKFNKQDLNEFLDYRCEWLMSLLSTVDLLPIGFYLIKVIDEKEQGEKKLPIIFTNRFFEVMTSTNLSSIQTQDKSFDQLFISEKNQSTAEYRDSQNCGKDFLGSMSISRTDDWDIPVVIGFKAIFNPDQKYAFGIGLINEIVANCGQPKLEELKNYMSQLVKLLPNKIINYD